MRFKIEVNDLRRATALTRSVADQSATIPIVRNVLVEAHEDSVSFLSTNLNYELQSNVRTVPERTGSATVSATVISEVARRLPNGSLVEITKISPGEKLEIRAGRTKLELATLPTEDFPVMAFEDFTTSFSAEMKAIRRLFAKSRVAISLDPTRKYLNGLYFHAIKPEGPEGGESKLSCVATDGFQLAKIDAAAPAGAAEMDGVIIPERTVQEVVKILDDTDNQIEVSVSDTKIRFATPELMFTSRVVEGNFPDYKQLIPDSNPLELSAEADELLKAVRRVTTISQQETRAVQLVIEEGQLSLSVTEPGLGTAEDEVLVSFPHPKLSVKFVHRHLLNVVTQIDAGKVTFQLPTETGPTIVVGDADPEALYVVMPVRV